MVVVSLINLHLSRPLRLSPPFYSFLYLFSFRSKLTDHNTPFFPSTSHSFLSSSPTPLSSLIQHILQPDTPFLIASLTLSPYVLFPHLFSFSANSFAPFAVLFLSSISPSSSFCVPLTAFYPRPLLLWLAIPTPVYEQNQLLRSQ